MCHLRGGHRLVDESTDGLFSVMPGGGIFETCGYWVEWAFTLSTGIVAVLLGAARLQQMGLAWVPKDPRGSSISDRPPSSGVGCRGLAELLCSAVMIGLRMHMRKNGIVILTPATQTHLVFEQQQPTLIGRIFHPGRSYGCWPAPATGGLLLYGRYLVNLFGKGEKRHILGLRTQHSDLQ